MSEIGTPAENQVLHNRATSTSTSIPAQNGNVHYIYVDQNGQPVQQPVPVQVVYVDSNGQIIQSGVGPTAEPQQVVVPSQNVVPSQQVVSSTSPTNSGINNGSITGTISDVDTSAASGSRTNNKMVMIVRIAGAICGALATLFFGIGLSNNELSSDTTSGGEVYCGWDGLHVESYGETAVLNYGDLCETTDTYCSAQNTVGWVMLIMVWAGISAFIGTIFIQPLCARSWTGCNSKSLFSETTTLGLIALLVWTIGDDGGCGQYDLGSTMNLNIAGFVFAGIAGAIGIYAEHLQK